MRLFCCCNRGSIRSKRGRFLRNCPCKIGNAATAGSSYGHSSDTASDSICPKGWRLPGYDGSGSYLELLKPYSNRSGNKDFTNADTVIQLAPLSFLRAGLLDYSNGNLNYRALGGFYWSSRHNSHINGHYLYFSSPDLHPQNSSDRGYGFSVRCLAR